jgi:hypothetical protein
MSVVDIARVAPIERFAADGTALNYSGLAAIMADPLPHFKDVHPGGGGWTAAELADALGDALDITNTMASSS